MTTDGGLSLIRFLCTHSGLSVSLSFATRKMQRLQYEANMCQRGVFTYQLEKHNIQTSQELYELFDVVPELQKSIEQIRVAETRDKNGKAQKSRGCGHILFPNKEVLNDARVYLDGVG